MAEQTTPSRPERRGWRRGLHSAVAVTLVLSVMALLDVANAPSAAAATPTPPIAAKGPDHVTSDVLPTVQVNGVVWDQEVVGNKVYAVGSFTSARPAGSPAGVNEVPRSNMLAYDITTGELDPNFAPVLNRQAKTVEASPDGSRIYIGGEFTQVDGTNRYRIAALEPTTGALVTGFNAIVDFRVNALVVTPTTVYAGGAFNFSGSTSRTKLAAFSTSNGNLLTNWVAQADGEVYAMVLAPAGDKLFVGGRFQNINGSSAFGLAALSPADGSLIPWAANQVIRNAGSNAAILSLTTDGTSIYGSGYRFGSGGNLEGAFSADPVTGQVNWVEDCHGDTYDVEPINGYLYTVSHAHFCGNVGGFGQSSPWGINGREAISFTTHATGVLRHEPWNYANWQGTPAPSMVNWFPDMAQGTFTGLSQAGWTVEGNADYVVIGGEFPSVNGVGQQGLVRFARKPIAPGNDGPRLGEANFPINVRSLAAGEVRISFPANHDRDDKDLEYRIIRDGVNGSPVHVTTVESTHWNRPIISFTDKGLTPGAAHTYRVRVADGDGNTAWSSTIPVTVASSGSPSTYADTVMANGAQMHWRLGEASGTTSVDQLGFRNLNRAADAQFGATGALTNEADTAASFSNSSQSFLVDPNINPDIQTFSIEAWVRTSSVRGGRIMGMSSSQSGLSNNHDRVLYMTDDGRVMFGTNLGGRRTVESPAGLNDGTWHHLVGTVGTDGMNLYVDGVKVASRGDVTGGQGFNGYWKVGADRLNNWPNRPTRDYLTGQIDEPAVYYKVLSPSEVAENYAASGRTAAVNPPPGDAYGAAVYAADPFLYHRLAEASGATAADSGRQGNPGEYQGSVGRGAGGVVATNPAASFGGSGFVSSRSSTYSPAEYSAELWFKTTTTTGGHLIGFGNSRTGESSTSDRQVVMRDDGRLTYSVLPALNGVPRVEVTTAGAYNDGDWHHVVAVQSATGMQLYVDGNLAASGAPVIGRVYAGYWRVGGDATNGASTSTNVTATIDEAAVYTRALGGSEVLDHYVLGGGEAPNLAPTASISASLDDMELSVDGSGSTDADGTIVSYEWDFGDGATASGVTASHTYAAPGTYTVTLTVTDDDGATDQATQQVQVVANQAPVPSFNATATGLVASLDASASTDADGTIVSYDWDFGDGANGSGVTASHTYAAPGTYTVTLTVTDDDGATAQTTRQVTVTSTITYAADTFSRSVSGGFGTAETGGAWTVQGTASNYSVNGSVGRITVPSPGQSRSATLNPAGAIDVDSTVQLSLDKNPTGGGSYVSSVLRKVGSSEYRLRVRFQPSATTVQLMRVVNGAETTIASTSLPGTVYTAGTTVNMRFRATGSGTTTLQGKVWLGAAAEPAAWQVQTTDTTGALQSSTGVGVHMYESGSSTSTPVVLSVDNLLVRSP